MQLVATPDQDGELGHEIKDPLFIPKSPEEIHDLYSKNPEVAPAHLKEAYEILCEGKLPASPLVAASMPVNLATFMETRFTDRLLQDGTTRGKLAQRAIQSWMGTGLNSEAEELFQQLKAYGFDKELPDIETLRKTGLVPWLCGLLSLKSVRREYKDWVK